MSRLLLLITFFIAVHAGAQVAAVDSALSPAGGGGLWPGVDYSKTLDKLDKTYQNISGQLDKQTEKYLSRLEKQEQAIRKKLQALDSNKAKQLLGNTETYYAGLKEKLANPTKKIQALQQYIPGLDSIQTATKFLSKLDIGKGQLDKITNLNSSVGVLQDKLQSATNIKKMLQQRQEELKSRLTQYDMGKYLKKMNKQVYYYQQQLGEYKTMLQDRRKLEAKAMSIVRSLPAFKNFMQKNSQLAALFPSFGNSEPGASGAQAIAGLQTRASVQAQLAQRLPAGGASGNPQQYLQQQVQAGQAQLNQLKDKLNRLGGSGGGDLTMPDFTPNSQKTKSFWKRIEYGFNVQSQKQNRLLPTTSDLALTAGFKPNDKSVIGIGVAYKLGWGDIKCIQLSNQGVGLRSYLDVKIPSPFRGRSGGGFWITGGYELNWLPALNDKPELLSIPGLKNPCWQRSGLAGLTKKQKIGKKTAQLQLLWDFLSYNQVPQTQVLKFRVGYIF